MFNTPIPPQGDGNLIEDGLNTIPIGFNTPIPPQGDGNLGILLSFSGSLQKFNTPIPPQGDGNL